MDGKLTRDHGILSIDWDSARNITSIQNRYCLRVPSARPAATLIAVAVERRVTAARRVVYVYTARISQQALPHLGRPRANHLHSSLPMLSLHHLSLL